MRFDEWDEDTAGCFNGWRAGRKSFWILFAHLVAAAVLYVLNKIDYNPEFFFPDTLYKVTFGVLAALNVTEIWYIISLQRDVLWIVFDVGIIGFLTFPVLALLLVLQLLAALSHSPGILILDEPTNHLDQYSRDLMVNALRSFDGIGIIISHDRTFASALSSRTVILGRDAEGTVSAEDIPLPLPEALEESGRRRKAGREAYDGILSAISAERAIVRNLQERSRAKQRKLTKRDIDSRDHDAKARIDGARLSGKDASLDGAVRNHQTHSRQLGDKLASISKPLKRKEGLTLSSGIYVPTLSFPEAVLIAGGYSLAVPSLTVAAGSHIAITGRNGSGKTLFLKAFHEHLLSQGKGRWVLYIPQEFSDAERESLISSFLSLTDDERGIILSDLYRMGSEPSSLFSESPCPSPGELKKLALAMSRRDGRTVLIMDEPTNHLDIVSMRILEGMFREDGKEMTMLLVSHDVAFLSACTDTVWRVERNGSSGRLIPS